MDTKHFELLLRRTPLCQALLSDAWEGLNTGQRIDLLLHLVGPSAAMPADLLAKAITDPNAVVRMLAAKGSYISERDDPDLYARLMNDPSPFVRAAMKGDKLFIDKSDLSSLTDHVERLGVIALADFVSDEAFAAFISEGLAQKTLSEEEAAELVIEFVRNPNNISGIEKEPVDGLDWYSITKGFEAMWSLTTSTPLKVHHIIAWEYPLRTGDGPALSHTIPDEMLDRMSTHALEALAHRQYEPLLKKLKETPDKYDEKVHEAARLEAEFGGSKKSHGRSEIASLREELEEFRVEVRERVDELAQQITDFMSRRRGLFG